MTIDKARERKRLLDPIERTMEVLFGLIMVLTFTGSLSAADTGRDDVRDMLIGALGCNLAWGLIDGVMYLLSSTSERARMLRGLKALRAAPDPAQGRRIIAGALPPMAAEAAGTEGLEKIRLGLIAMPEPPRRVPLGRDDWLGALAVFAWVFLSTFPVVIPFLFVSDARTALRISNGIAIALLFTVGYALGRYSGARAWRTGLGMVLIGVVLVGITIALGG